MPTSSSLSFIDLLERSWNHMLEVLFRPFDLGKWCVLGFAAWLAGLTSMNGGGGSGGPNVRTSVEQPSSDIAHSFSEAIEYLRDHPVFLGVALLAILAVLAVLVLLTWISSRAKFIFLDGVVWNRAAIKEPWTRFRELGNSLFVFRLVFGLALSVVGLLVASGLIFLLLGEHGYAPSIGLTFFPALLIVGTVGMLLGLLVLGLYFALDAFVVPIMYRTGLTVMPAWREFWTLFKARAGSFILCALLVFALALLVAAGLVVIGLLTCCVGFVLLMLPYIGTILLLPVFVAYRTFTVLFLAEIEPHFDAFAAAREAAVPDPPLAPVTI